MWVKAQRDGHPEEQVAPSVLLLQKTVSDLKVT